LQEAIIGTTIRINEFTVGTLHQLGLPYHEWFIEFDPEASGEPETT
jgi:hypothetical protein